jgi:TolB protein
MQKKILLAVALLLLSSFITVAQTPAPFDLAYLQEQAEMGRMHIILSRTDGSEWLDLTENLTDSFLPVWSPDGRFLAFVTETEGSLYEIYAVEIETGIVTAVTDLGWYSSMPTYAPDGSEIAFAASQDGTVLGNLDIYTINTDGSDLNQITDNEAAESEPQWSPDGSQLAYVIEFEDFRRDIWLQDLEDPEYWANLTESRITGDWNEHAPRWSPDGAWLIFVTHRDTESLLATLDPIGVDYIFYPNPDEVTQIANPVWSPDGTSILVEAEANGNSDIYLFHANSADYSRLTDDAAFDGEPVWSADGRQIAFISERDGNREVYIMNADGSEQTRITSTDEAEHHPLWRPVRAEARG